MSNIRNDDFYKDVADIINIKGKKYSTNDLLNKNRDERLKYYSPTLNFNSIEDICDYFNIETTVIDKRLDDLDATDYTFCLIFGAVGAIISHNLEIPFAKLHDKGYTNRDNPLLFKIQKFLEHKHDLNDIEQGFGHRPAFGHDIFNLKEIKDCIDNKFSQLSKLNPNGSYLYSLAAGKIIKHLLLADPLSTEGLPIPGHTLFRNKLVKFAKQNQSLYQKLFTIKARDLVGAGAVTVFSKVYKEARNIESNSYRYYQINLLANSILVVMSYLLAYSINYPALFKILTDSARMAFIANKMSNEFNKQATSDLERVINLAREKYGFSEKEINTILK